MLSRSPTAVLSGVCHFVPEAGVFFTLVLTVLRQPGMAPRWEEGLGGEEAGRVSVSLRCSP